MKQETFDEMLSRLRDKRCGKQQSKTEIGGATIKKTVKDLMQGTRLPSRKKAEGTPGE